MALYANGEKNRSKEEFGENHGKSSGLPPAEMDEILLDALDALEQTRKLHESTPNPETKRQAKRILMTLHSSLLKLAPFGIHSARRLERMPMAP